MMLLSAPCWGLMMDVAPRSITSPLPLAYKGADWDVCSWTSWSSGYAPKGVSR